MASLFLNLLFRSALILLATYALYLFGRSWTAASRHRILFCGLTLLMLWPLFALLVPVFDISPWLSTNGHESVTVQETVFVSVHRLKASLLPTWIALLWLAGIGISLLPVVAGFFKALAIVKCARPLNHQAANLSLLSLCGQLGIAKPPSLFVMSEQLMPFVFGIGPGKILLPLGCAAWSDLRWRTVLLHELAHLKRRDVATQIFASLVTALWWFQPLCRTVYSALRAESERACDAMVLACGIKPSDYADQLLQLARTSPGGHPYSPAAVTMASHHGLEIRVTAILDPTPQRQGRRFAFAAICSLVLLTITASAVTTKEGPSMKRTLLSGLLTSAGLSAATIGGSLLDATGAAIPNAKASLYNPDTTTAQETATANDGKFSFSVPAGQYILRIQKPGFPSLFREFNVKTDSKIERSLTFSQPATFEDQKVVRVGGEAMQAKLVQKITPLYPVSAKRDHIEGIVNLEAVISTDGVPQDITVLSSPSDDLTQSALEAVRQWRYSDTLLNGNPVAVVTDIIVHYTLLK